MRGQRCGLRGFDGLAGGFAELLCADDGEAGLLDEALALLDVRAGQAGDDRDGLSHLLLGVDDALGDDVDAGHAAEDVDEDGLHVGIARDDEERVHDLVNVVGGGDIEEVRGLAAGELDGVHGRHGEAGAVDETADVAIEFDEVADALLGGFDLGRILLVFIAQGLDVLVAEEGVVVDVHLGVEGEDAAVLRDDERVDLCERRIAGDEGVVERGHELRRGLHQATGEAEGEAEFAGEVLLETGDGIDGDAVDGLRGLCGDLLDLHAAGGAGHHHRAAGGAIDEDGEVELALDGHLLLDEDGLHLLALGAGLVGDELHAEDLREDPGGLVGGVGELDAAALAAAACVDLGLDDDLAAELVRGRPGVFGGGGDAALRDGDAEAGENLLRLELVDLHRWFPSRWLLVDGDLVAV
jgi:hypothetical protein